MVEYQVEEQGDWLGGVRKLVSPNCDLRPEEADINLLVIHSISLPPNEFGGGFVDQLFTNSLDPEAHPYFKEIEGLEVSAHLFINRQGEVTQYVPFTQRAWHAGQSEFKGETNCNDFSIGIELEGTDHDQYTAIQYDVLAKVTNAITNFWPKITKERITGHCHIAPERKTDPGPLFDWEKFYSLINVSEKS